MNECSIDFDKIFDDEFWEVVDSNPPIDITDITDITDIAAITTNPVGTNPPVNLVYNTFDTNPIAPAPDNYMPYAIYNTPFMFDQHQQQYQNQNQFTPPNQAEFEPNAMKMKTKTAVPNEINSSDLCRALDEVLARSGFENVPLARFKKEAGNAWRRKNPDGRVPMRQFQTFVKANIKGVRGANPEASHAEHMRAIGRMWRDTKNECSVGCDGDGDGEGNEGEGSRITGDTCRRKRQHV